MSLFLIYSHKDSYSFIQDAKMSKDRLLDTESVVTVDDVMEQLKSSRATAFRFLKKSGFLTSINFRGKFHVERSSLRFDGNGLSKRGDTVFSMHGNLLQTIERLIEVSPNGMAVTELNELVGTQTYIQCAQLHRDKRVFRKKYSGVYCYFSIDPEKQKAQREQRAPKREFDLNSAVESESNIELTHDVIKVLVTYIKNPSSGPKNIALSLLRSGHNIRTRRVTEILEKYDIVKKSL